MRNRILVLRDENNREKFSEGSKGRIATDYFQNLFTSSQSQSLDMEELFEGFTPRVTAQMNAILTSPVTSTEIKDAVLSLNRNSSPGADGLTAAFYQSMWATVGPSLTQEVMAFFLICVFTLRVEFYANLSFAKSSIAY